MNLNDIFQKAPEPGKSTTVLAADSKPESEVRRDLKYLLRYVSYTI